MKNNPNKKKITKHQSRPGNLSSDGTRLNKFLANAGIAARRKADEMVRQGLVKVNGKEVTEPGFRLMPNDKVTLNGKPVLPGNRVYVLLNKPKDFITTVSDEKDRKTVMDLVKKATAERIFPVGRLDRNTTGLLLLTNDGELANNLAHPSAKVEKIYSVTLDKPLSESDYILIKNGVELEDGIARVDEIAFPEANDKKVVGISIHIGKNRIVRRIFEHLGYQVSSLDRVIYAGLTKKNLPRGKWRHLGKMEIIKLKHFSR